MALCEPHNHDSTHSAEASEIFRKNFQGYQKVRRVVSLFVAINCFQSAAKDNSTLRKEYRNRAPQLARPYRSCSAQVTASDYLDHNRLFGVVSDLLKDRKSALRFLDLGCGDAGNMVKVLNTSSNIVASYTGEYLRDSSRSSMRPKNSYDSPDLHIGLSI